MRAKRVSISTSIERETLPQFFQRVRSGGARKPLRSLRELAEEFGVPHKTLQAKLARCKDAPRPIYSTGDSKTTSQRNTWYDPHAVRAWWAAHQKAALTTTADNQEQPKGHEAKGRQFGQEVELP